MYVLFSALILVLLLEESRRVCDMSPRAGRWQREVNPSGWREGKSGRRKRWEEDQVGGWQLTQDPAGQHNEAGGPVSEQQPQERKYSKKYSLQETDSKPPEGLLGFHTDWLTLNVGERYFTTTWSTLVNKEPDSMLVHMFKDRGAFLIDRSPECFEPILNYLHHGQLIVNDGINLLGVLEEARFFGIYSLIEHLEVAIKNSQPLEDHSPISRKEFVQFLLCANLQGVKMLCSNDPSGLKANLEGANLKGVDMEGSQMTGINLRVATLKNAKLKNCNLRGATLAGTNLEKCDLSGCDLQEANLRRSNVKGARFEEMLAPLHMSQSIR
uniref:BTB domain-containing protein n=1 Tax=Theropithecus gelada TaxID=9565 RepID=A0A8D2JWQ6_THEGE